MVSLEKKSSPAPWPWKIDRNHGDVKFLEGFRRKLYSWGLEIAAAVLQQRVPRIAAPC